MQPSTTNEALCCCEYQNENGERSHILGCLCDCEALDQTFDRCITCRPVPDALKRRMFNTIADRCRIPGFTGAKKMDLEFVVPIVAVTLALTIATINFYVTVVTLAALPLIMLLFYRSWKMKQDRTRTKFFFVWAVYSVFFSYLMFFCFTVPFREIYLWENLLLFTCVALMFYFLYKVRQRTSIVSVKSQRMNEQSHRTREYDKTVTDSEMGNFLLSNMGFEKDSFKRNYEEQTAPTVDEANVTWVDSRPIKNGQLVTWCEKCCIVKPPRSGHCNICSACIYNRDHHCVWIDCCIGAYNHKYFMGALTLFVFCGFYGALLTLTTVCTPTMYYDWYLLPTNCNLVYEDFGTAISFVCACYAILGSCMMCMALLVQFSLISQNVTSQEFHQASFRRMTSMGLYVKRNVHNKGFFSNWLNFLFSSRKPSVQITV